MQHSLLDKLHVEKCQIEQGLDLVQQREIELRRPKDGLKILHRRGSQLAAQTESSVQLHLFFQEFIVLTMTTAAMYSTSINSLDV